jgi:redox-sensitive bicupin YhaK (pirin superfamily)
LISPDKERTDTLWINQDATFSLGDFEAGQKVTYNFNTKGNGVYAFMIEGTARIEGTELNKRDGIGIYDTDSIIIETEAKSRILLMEIPMLQ